MRLCGIAGLVLPLSVPSTLLGKGIYFLPMYSSHLSGRNGIYGIHAMGKHHHRSYQVSARPSGVLGRLSFNGQFTSAVL